MAGRRRPQPRERARARVQPRKSDSRRAETRIPGSALSVRGKRRNTRSKARLSIFTPSTNAERAGNFESYWVFTQSRDGEILEDRRESTRKNELLANFQNNPVRSRKLLPDPELFYRNYVRMKDDPRTFDRKTLLLTFLYKFARQRKSALRTTSDQIPDHRQVRRNKREISRYHLCEEFCHVRLFHEMLRTSTSTAWSGCRSASGWAGCTGCFPGSRSPSCRRQPSSASSWG